MQEVANLYPDKKVFDHADKGRFNMFDKVSGTNKIRETFSISNNWDDVKPIWNKGVNDFKILSKKYYLYK